MTLPHFLNKLVFKPSCRFVAILAIYPYKHILANSLDSLLVLAGLSICYKRLLRPRERDLGPLVGIC